ncbi:hypothetical protein D9756_006606 [Leucocoprinus leucothites]|uniref:Protein kinase domain-containing protein n=1 Tax=Leucocoprinus leucothites TaxID=201217 RepID=A0A8H5LH09_9AGAR|nr:hypothetical protein D9756_006606 [Leucoagaricus leucothites]
MIQKTIARLAVLDNRPPVVNNLIPSPTAIKLSVDIDYQHIGDTLTQFIETVLGPHRAILGAAPQAGISALRITFKDNEQPNLVLIDTPGFDDACRTDWEVLQAIVRWFNDVGTKDSRTLERTVLQRVSGFLWLHPITDTDFFFSTTTNFDIFTRFCGKNFHDRIIFTTTMWPEENSAEEEKCHNREQELKGTHWKSMIDSGSKVHRFTRTLHSAQAIINLVLEIEAKRPSRDLPHGPMLEAQKGVLPHEGKSIQEHQARQESIDPSQSCKPPPICLQKFYSRNFDNIDTAIPVTTKDLNKDDMIIIIIGPTGAGKSTFIQIITGPYYSNMEVGHRFRSTTSDVSAVRIIFKAGNIPNLVLVDTPGFDGGDTTDSQIMETIAAWRNSENAPLRISGILYMHNITDARASGSILGFFEMFQKLCGEKFYDRVILVTTMWPDENAFTYRPEEQAECEKRNEELVNDYWDIMIDSGSKVRPFLRTSHSAEDIVNEIANAECNAQVRVLNQMRIQKEMVDEHKPLPHTQAGKRLHRLINELVGRRNGLLEQLMEEQVHSVQQDPRAVGEILDELKSLQRGIEKAKRDMQRLNVSPMRRLIAILRAWLGIGLQIGRRSQLLHNRFQPPAMVHRENTPPMSTSISDVILNNNGPRLYDSARATLLEIVMDHAKSAAVTDLRDAAAQSMLLADHALTADEKGPVFELLLKLAGSAQVFPGCYKLRDVDYDLGHPVSIGTFGAAHKTTWQGNDIRVKIVRVDERQSTSLVRHIQTLGRVFISWAQLSHTNILPFYGVLQPEENMPRICIVSPWVSKGDLSSYLTCNPKVPQLPLTDDIVTGLAYLHESKIVHGNLKATNILISDDGRAIIADFGIFAMTTESRGAFNWMAPELLTAEGPEAAHITPECDIWSFGCICFEIFVGRIPFAQYNDDKLICAFMTFEGAMNPLKALLASEGNEVQLPEGLSDGSELRMLMESCWQHEPAARPTCIIIKQIIDRLGVSDNQPPVVNNLMPPPTAIRLSVDIDYQRVCDTLTQIQQGNTQSA